MRRRSVLIMPIRQLLMLSGVTADWLIQHGFNPDHFKDPSLISLDKQLEIVEQINTSLHHDGWGIELGREISFASLGAFGYSVIAAPSLHESMRIQSEFFQILTPYFEPTIVEHDDEVQVQFWPVEDIGYLEYEIANMLITMQVQHINHGFPKNQKIIKLGFCGPKRSYIDIMEEFFGTALQFDQPCYSLTIPNELYYAESPFFEKDIWQLARENCKKQLSRINYHDTSDPAIVVEQSLDEAISENRRLGLCNPLPSVEELARKMHIKESTLRDQLRAKNMQYRKIKENCRRRWLEEFLSSTTFSIQEISGMLGYQDSTNFARACRKWYNTSPSRLRAAQK